jgi:hypothetical protein
MLTNARVMLRFSSDPAETASDWLEHFVQRATRRAGQLRCGITGHNILIRYEPARLSLQCTTCGYESPGWELEPPRATPPRTQTRLGPSVAA